jgi:hypothetical protein
MATWPSDLPDAPLIQGYQETKQPAVKRTSMDSGRPKRRKRFDRSSTRFTTNFRLTAAQLATLESFFEDTLDNGALGFDWNHPRKGTQLHFYFMEPYKVTALSPDVYEVSAKLEVLP